MRAGIATPARFGPQPPRPEDVVILDGGLKKAVDTAQTRLLVAAALFGLAFIVVSARLVDLMVLRANHEPAAPIMAAKPDNSSVIVNRADIVDRNGVVLATSLPTQSLFANPRQILDKDEAITQLLKTLPDLKESDLRAKLASDKNFVWVRRNLTPRQQYQVNRLGIPGLYFQREERRIYPLGGLTAHVVGFTDIDHRGLAGIEQSFDDVLKAGTQPVQLSIDVRVQSIVREELQRAIIDFTAIGGVGMVMDVQTGELLAMVSLPDFDPNNPNGTPPDTRFNRATLGTYEMGSTFKIFNTAMALDGGFATLESHFDASAPIRIGKFSIEDYEPVRRALSVPEIIMHSSNIGSARMASAAGTPAQRSFMQKLGFLQRAAIEIPETGQPLYPKDWKPINTMTIAFGHGMAISPVHLVTGVAAMVNGGILRHATLIRRSTQDVADGTRIIKPETSVAIRNLMRLVVQAGTGRKSDVPGYLVGGKTGTAEKQTGKGYNKNSRLSSFISTFPVSNPRFVVLVMVDEPKPNKSSYGFATGGWVAAPAVGRIIQRMGPMLGIEPIPDSAPEAINPILYMVKGQPVPAQPATPPSGTGTPVAAAQHPTNPSEVSDAVE